MGLPTLRTTAEFERVFAEKKKFYKNGLGFYFRITGEKLFRFGIVTPKRFGKAVERNKFRRRIRELIRRNLENSVGAEVVFSVYKPLAELGFPLLKQTLGWALERIRRVAAAGISVRARSFN